tara:strand:+ start:866 stop:1063 length:198 start_codon:yes stop_codon:yes gene_type:complete
MSKDEKIAILSELQVIAETMKKVSEEMLIIPVTPSNIDNFTTLAELMSKMIKDGQKLMETVFSMK